MIDQSHILQFALPLTSSSVPQLILPNSFNAAIATDSNANIATSDGLGNIAIYSAPLSSSSTPFATFTNGAFTSAYLLTFDTAGDLFAAGQVGSSGAAGISIFAHPLSSASTPAQVIPLSNVVGMALDASGNLKFNLFAGVDECSSGVLQPPYTGQPSISTSSCADSSLGAILFKNNMFYSSDIGAGIGEILVGFIGQIIIQGPGEDRTPAVDRFGNVYVGNADNAGNPAIMALSTVSQHIQRDPDRPKRNAYAEQRHSSYFCCHRQMRRGLSSFRPCCMANLRLKS